jgi:hypothetical protein
MGTDRPNGRPGPGEVEFLGEKGHQALQDADGAGEGGQEEQGEKGRAEKSVPQGTSDNMASRLIKAKPTTMPVPPLPWVIITTGTMAHDRPIRNTRMSKSARSNRGFMAKVSEHWTTSRSRKVTHNATCPIAQGEKQWP